MAEGRSSLKYENRGRGGKDFGGEKVSKISLKNVTLMSISMIGTKQAIISQGVLRFKPDELNGLSDKTPGAEEVIYNGF